MAKVDFPEGSSPFFNPIAYSQVKKEEKKVKGHGKVPAFSKLLETAEADEAPETAQTALDHVSPSEEVLKALLDDIHQAGEALSAKPIMDTIKRYKEAVRAFLHYVVENGYTAEERMSGFNILKRKKFTLVQVVDRKLEQLAAGILSGQRTQLDILARVEEINGLLVDLTR